MFGDDVRLIRLSQEHEIKPFDCEDGDLNEFLLEDAKKHLHELLAVTYLIENDTDTIAFFSVLNDKIAYEDAPNGSQWKKVRGGIPRAKHIKSYPCVKIGRLGVTAKFKGKRYGTKILDYIKILFVDTNKTGCRFITLDAYNKPHVIKFYQDNGFKLLPSKQSGLAGDTVLMYYDLMPVSVAMSTQGDPGETDEITKEQTNEADS